MLQRLHLKTDFFGPPMDLDFRIIIELLIVAMHFDSASMQPPDQPVFAVEQQSTEAISPKSFAGCPANSILTLSRGALRSSHALVPLACQLLLHTAGGVMNILIFLAVGLSAVFFVGKVVQGVAIDLFLLEEILRKKITHG